MQAKSMRSDTWPMIGIKKWHNKKSATKFYLTSTPSTDISSRGFQRLNTQKDSVDNYMNI